MDLALQAGLVGHSLGALTKSGTGTWTLSGASTYTGATNINAGTLNFSALNNLGSGTAINFGGGTLQYASGNTADISARTVTLNAGGGPGAAVDVVGIRSAGEPLLTDTADSCFYALAADPVKIRWISGKELEIAYDTRGQVRTSLQRCHDVAIQYRPTDKTK